MMINATLLVQIINFLAAYYLLRFLFLTPFSTLIQQEEESKKRQQAAINDQKNQIVHYSALKREEWQHCQQYFRENSPKLFDQFLLERKVRPVTMHEVSEAEIKKMREDVTKLIISRIEHVS